MPKDVLLPRECVKKVNEMGQHQDLFKPIALKPGTISLKVYQFKQS